jgi:hypothetical protein
MDCRNIELSPSKSHQRIENALYVFPRDVLMRLLAFTLHLLGAPRQSIAELLNMPSESIKTVVRVTMRDGLDALRDRRRTSTPVPCVARKTEPITVRQDDQSIVIELPATSKSLRIPLSARVQAKTVLLTFVNAGLLSPSEAANVLGLRPAHCRALSRKLETQDVAEVLVDKRRGQQQDYRVGMKQKSELIQQLAARAITGQSTSSETLALVVNKNTHGQVSARSVRLFVQKFGLGQLKETLPRLVEQLKKTSMDC